jgi:hypothetical protein
MNLRLVLIAMGFVIALSAQAEISIYHLDQALPLGAGAPPQFGLAVAIDGDRLVVTSPNTPSHPYSVAGFYTLDSSKGWIGESGLEYDHIAVDAGSYLPCNPIALLNDVLLVGVADSPGGGGKVLVAQHTGSDWNFSSVLSPATPSAFESFGCSVGLSGDTIVIGAPGHSETGAGYIFVRQPDKSWVFQSQLVASAASKNDAVGLSAAIDGDLAVLGAPHANSDEGAVYVFKRSGSTWTNVKKLSASGGVAGDQFGASVAVSNGTIVVGAPERDSGQGAVYIYSGASFNDQPFPSSPPDTNFGSAVALSGNRLIVGAIGGASAYAYTRSGMKWYERGLILHGSIYSRLGGSVAISGTTAVVGAMGVNSAYVLHDDQIFANGYQ